MAVLCFAKRTLKYQVQILLAAWVFIRIAVVRVRLRLVRGQLPAQTVVPNVKNKRSMKPTENRNIDVYLDRDNNRYMDTHVDG